MWRAVFHPAQLDRLGLSPREAVVTTPPLVFLPETVIFAPCLMCLYLLWINKPLGAVNSVCIILTIT